MAEFDYATACARNIGLLPSRARMEEVCEALRAFCGEAESGREPDRDVLARLGEPTPERRWLAASLDKTIRLQLRPPAAMREASVLSGPDWILE